MNVRKAGLWTGGILLFLILAAFVAVRVLVDPQHLREMARDKVRKHLSRELTLADVKLEFSPLPSIHAVDVSITGKDEPPSRRRRSSPTWSSCRCCWARRNTARCT
jgi:uncharacterized protein involved in outer membrane biogenesis